MIEIIFQLSDKQYVPVIDVSNTSELGSAYMYLHLNYKASAGRIYRQSTKTAYCTDFIHFKLIFMNELNFYISMTSIWKRHFPYSKSSLEPHNIIQTAFAQCSTRGLSKSFQKSVSQLFMQLWLPSCCDGIQHNFSPLNSKSIEGSVPSRIMRSTEQKIILKHFGKSKNLELQEKVDT